MGAIIRFLTVVALSVGGLYAQPSDTSLFWEPELSHDQSFIVLRRSIKAFALSRYDIIHENDSYPVTELNVELTHGVVHFLHIGMSRGKKQPLTLKEIAEGRFSENNGLERISAGRQPPADLQRRSTEPARHVRFSMPSPQAVEDFYLVLKTQFKTAYPW